MMGLMSSQDADLFSDDEGPALEINKGLTQRDLPDSDSDADMLTSFRKAKQKGAQPISRKKEVADNDDATPDPFLRMSQMSPPMPTSPRVGQTSPPMGQTSPPMGQTSPLMGQTSPPMVQRPSAAPNVPKLEGPCPVLWCGRRHDKSVILSANQWITLGKEACTVRLPDKAVSARHCQIRWVSQSRTVEFVDTSLNGTWISGEKVHKNRLEPKFLQHGANIIVEAESSSNFFSFLLDMRNTGLALGDPRELPRGVDRRKQELERDKWKKHLLELRLRREKQENDILQKEQLFYELQAQRKDIDSRSQMWHAEIERLKVDTELILEKMFAKRKEWKEKLQELYKHGEAVAVPLTEKTIHKQEEVGKLEMQVNELEREIYPDRFALAELPEEEEKVKGFEETDNEQENTPGTGQPENEPQTSAPQQQSSGYAPTTPAKTPAPDSGAYQHDSAPALDSAPAIDSAKFEAEVMEMVAENSAQAGASAEAANSAEIGEPATKRPRVEKAEK